MNALNFVPLSQVCDVIDPHPSHRAPDRAVDGIPFVGIGDFDSAGNLQMEKARIVPASILTEHKARYSLEEDLLAVGRVASIGKVVRLPRTSSPFLVSPTLAVVRPRGIDISYLFFALHAPQFQEQLGTLSRGSTRRSVGIVDLRTATIPVPSVTEQRRLVRLLDEVFDGLATTKASAERVLRNANILFESHLQSVFTQRGPGWVERPLSELCEVKHGYAFEGEFFSNKGEYVLLTPGNFYERGGYRDRREKQKYYIGEIAREYVLNEGDLLVAMTEQAAGLLGSPILVPESNRFLHNQRLGLVKSKPGVAWTNEFFFHVFNTQPVRRAIHAAASGVKVRHTSPRRIGEVVVAFPNSLPDQKRIVATLALLSGETQRLAHLYERKLAALEELKKSLLQQAFSGAL